MKVERRTRGPASANLQGRKPRDVGRSGASDAMGISVLAVCCRGGLTACLANDRWDGELGQPIAMGRTGMAQRRANNTTAIQDGARASLFIAGRQPANQKGNTGGSPRMNSEDGGAILGRVVKAQGTQF